jgi:hypothetical protein
MYIKTYIYIYVHINIYIHTYIHIHIYTYTGLTSIWTPRMRPEGLAKTSLSKPSEMPCGICVYGVHMHTRLFEQASRDALWSAHIVTLIWALYIYIYIYIYMRIWANPRIRVSSSRPSEMPCTRSPRQWLREGARRRGTRRRGKRKGERGKGGSGKGDEERGTRKGGRGKGDARDE